MELHVVYQDPETGTISSKRYRPDQTDVLDDPRVIDHYYVAGSELKMSEAKRPAEEISEDSVAEKLLEILSASSSDILLKQAVEFHNTLWLHVHRHEVLAGRTTVAAVRHSSWSLPLLRHQPVEGLYDPSVLFDFTSETLQVYTQTREDLAAMRIDPELMTLVERMQYAVSAPNPLSLILQGLTELLKRWCILPLDAGRPTYRSTIFPMLQLAVELRKEQSTFGILSQKLLEISHMGPYHVLYEAPVQDKLGGDGRALFELYSEDDQAWITQYLHDEGEEPEETREGPDSIPVNLPSLRNYRRRIAKEPEAITPELSFDGETQDLTPATITPPAPQSWRTLLTQTSPFPKRLAAFPGVDAQTARDFDDDGVSDVYDLYDYMEFIRNENWSAFWDWSKGFFPEDEEGLERRQVFFSSALHLHKMLSSRYPTLDGPALRQRFGLTGHLMDLSGCPSWSVYFMIVDEVLRLAYPEEPYLTYWHLVRLFATAPQDTRSRLRMISTDQLLEDLESLRAAHPSIVWD